MIKDNPQVMIKDNPHTVKKASIQECQQESSVRAVEWLLKHNNRFAHCYNCTVCRKAFNCPWLLIVHFRIHMWPFKCGFCGKGFSRIWILKSNIRRHTWKALSMPNMWRTICWALKFETAFFFFCNALMICPITILQLYYYHMAETDFCYSKQHDVTLCISHFG